MTVLDMSKARDPGRRLVREAALRIADSIHNKSLRQHCIEQLCASETPEERRAAVALVTELAQEDRRLLDSESIVHSILDSTSDCITITDLQGNIRFMNRPGQRAMEIHEFAPLHGQPWSSLWPSSVEKALDKAINVARNGRNGHFSGYGPTSGGASKWWEVSVVPIPGPDGAPARLLGIAQDMTERRHSEQQLFQLEHFDSLTGLLNRNMLDRELAHALSETSQNVQTVFLFLDLDEFKAVNDSLGHSVGDQVLVAVAERLRGQMCGSDVIARFGGDEFAILTRVSGVDQVENLAGRVSAALNEPYTLHGREVTVGASIGIVVVSEPGAVAERVIRDADIALHQAKETCRGAYRFFDEAMGQNFRDREELKRDLRTAVARGELYLVYQPVMDFGTSCISDFEALLRWDHPTRGAVPPATFIPLAEDSGAIIEIGEWVLAQACQDAANWPDHVSIAVNISPVQVRNCALVETVSRCLSAAGVDPKRLSLEITETVLLAGSQRHSEILQDLRRLGCRISLDDFGTGYSSLSYLRNFPFDTIKIDRSFVSDLSRTDGRASRPDAILRGIVDLAHGLGVTVTAEGVETEAQAAALIALGCDHGQGYVFSPAVAKENVCEIMAAFGQTTGRQQIW